MSTAPTPGPWAVVEYENSICTTSIAVIGSDGETVCNDEPYYPHAVTREDAPLIAAAPELRDALAVTCRALHAFAAGDTAVIDTLQTGAMLGHARALLARLGVTL